MKDPREENRWSPDHVGHRNHEEWGADESLNWRDQDPSQGNPTFDDGDQNFEDGYETDILD